MINTYSQEGAYYTNYNYYNMADSPPQPTYAQVAQVAQPGARRSSVIKNGTQSEACQGQYQVQPYVNPYAYGKLSQTFHQSAPKLIDGL